MKFEFAPEHARRGGVLFGPDAEHEIEGAIELQQQGVRLRLLQHARMLIGDLKKKPADKFRIRSIGHPHRKIESHVPVGVTPIGHTGRDELRIRHDDGDVVVCDDRGRAQRNIHDIAGDWADFNAVADFDGRSMRRMNPLTRLLVTFCRPKPTPRAPARMVTVLRSMPVVWKITIKPTAITSSGRSRQLPTGLPTPRCSWQGGVLRWIVKQDGHLKGLDCALDDRANRVPSRRSDKRSKPVSAPLGGSSQDPLPENPWPIRFEQDAILRWLDSFVGEQANPVYPKTLTLSMTWLRVPSANMPDSRFEFRIAYEPEFSALLEGRGATD